jgi:hypothetical protein
MYSVLVDLTNINTQSGMPVGKITVIKELQVKIRKIIPSATKYQKEFLIQFLIALIASKTTNLVQIANHFIGFDKNPETVKIKSQSAYQRILRFFKKFTFDDLGLSRLLDAVLPESKYTLTFDRTTWQIGNTWINILCLAVVFDRVAVPILWTTLDKKGNSNTEERIKLINQFVSIYGVDKIESFLADREFVGESWFSYLIQQNIPFCIRLKENTKVNNEFNLAEIFNQTIKSKGEVVALPNPQMIWGQKLYLAASRNELGELMVVASSKPLGVDIINTYRNRWCIETMFGFFKSKGFNLEETHLSTPEKISTLFGILGIALVWCLVVGTDQHLKDKPIKLKKDKPASSIFAYGFNFMIKILSNLSLHTREIFKAIKLFLSPLPDPALIKNNYQSPIKKLRSVPDS